MAEFFQFVIGGLAIGSVYGLVALGFVLIFKSTDVFNFAQGDLLMLGAYITVTALVTFHLPLGPAMMIKPLTAARQRHESGGNRETGRRAVGHVKGFGCRTSCRSSR